MNLLTDIFTFAWRGKGKFLLITCSVLSVMTDLVGLAPLLGVFAKILLLGYFFAIYYQLIQSTAVGEKEAPEFPDVSDLWGDIIWPVLQICIITLVSFTPYIFYSIWSMDESENPLLQYGLLGFGIVYFPMATLAVVILGSTRALSPHIVLPAIIRVGRLYWYGVVLLLGMYFVSGLIDALFSGHVIIRSLIMAVVSSYVFMTNARILGIVYRERKEELNWL